MKWPKLLPLLLVALYLCVLPVHGETVDGDDKLLEGVGKVTGPKIVLPDEESRYPVYLEFSGLEQSFWLEVTVEKETIPVVAAALEPKGGEASAFVYLSHPEGTVTLNLYLYDTPGGQLEASAAMLVGLQEVLSFTAEDAVACTTKVQLSVLDKAVSLTGCLPLDTADPQTQLYGQLMDSDGKVYGSDAKPADIGSCSMEDSRYQGIFRENPYRVMVQGLKTELTLDGYLRPGQYDLVFSDDSGQERYRFPQAVECVDRPAVRLDGWTATPGAGEYTAGVSLLVANGEPEDFSVMLYHNDTLCSDTHQCQVLAYDSASDILSLRYQFALEEPLVVGAEYTAKILCNEDFFGEKVCALEAVRPQSGTIYAEGSCFDSAYFANVLLETAGLQPLRQYRAVLFDETGRELSEKLVTAGESGILDVEFTDEQGTLLPIDGETVYQVALYRWQSGGVWQLVDQIALQAALPPEDNGLPVHAEGMTADRLSVSHRVSVTGDEDVELQLYPAEGFSAQPEYTFQLIEPEYAIAHQKAGLQSSRRYRAIYRQNGRVIGAENHSYWVTARCMDNYLEVPFFELHITAPENGTVRLFSNAGEPVESGAWLGFSEVYVQAVPDSGYELEAILVNGQPITGRAFLVAENVQVEPVFRPRQAETFTIAAQCKSNSGTQGGALNCDRKAAALGDAVTVYAVPEDHYRLEALRVYEQESGLEVPLAAGALPDSWQFTMPGTAVVVEATYARLIQARILIQDYDKSAGRVQAPPLAWEGEEVILWTESSTGCKLQALLLKYTMNGQEHTVDLLEKAGEQPGTYWFIAPSTEMVTICPVFQVYTFQVTLAQQDIEGGSLQLSGSSARPGTTMWVKPLAAARYQLVPDTLQVKTASGTVLPLTFYAESGSWVFRMPWEDVQVSARFERQARMAPGGTVYDVPTLISALGGRDAAQEKAPGVVQLKNHVSLMTPIVFTGGDLTLDSGDSCLRSNFEGDALLVVEEGAALTLLDSQHDSGALEREGDCVLWLKGGQTTLSGGVVKGVIRAETGARLTVSGGSVYGGFCLPQALEHYLAPQTIVLDADTGKACEDVWTSAREPVGNVTFVRRAPVLDVLGITAAHTGEGQLTVTVPVNNATGEVTLVAALYAQDGQLLGACAMPCARGEAPQRLVVSYTGQPVEGRLFQWKTHSLVPQDAAISIPIPS